MNAIVFWLVSGCLYAANTWHLLWLPLVWICFPGILLAAGIAMLFDIVAMRNADTAIESAPGRTGQVLEAVFELGATGFASVLGVEGLWLSARRDMPMPEN